MDDLDGLSSAPGNPTDARIVGYTDVTRRYRRPLGGWWWAALVGVPLVLALVGGAIFPSASSPTPVETTMAVASAPIASTAVAATSATPTVFGSEYGLIRRGSTVTITGAYPDEVSRLAAVQAFKTAAGTGLVVVDQTTVAAGAVGATVAQAAALGAVTASVTDFAITANGSTLTLTGAAVDAASKAAAEKAVADAFPTYTVASSITVAEPVGCAGLVSQIAPYLQGHKLEFSPASSELTDASRAAVAQVASLVKACGTAKIAVNGYTDNQGDDSTSLPLSQARAQAVRDALVAAGVTNQITATGFGSANPVGDNSTDAGRAANRRVEIVIS